VSTAWSPSVCGLVEMSMYRSIVVGTDGSPTARGAVSKAAELAQLCGAKLLIVSAYPDASPAMMSAFGSMAASPPVDLREDVERMLRDLASEVARGGVSIEIYACPGNAANAILDIAEREECDLIVLGNRGMQGARRFLGSVPNNVAHSAPCSVLIVSTA
jgi:nucleotide-binding universal stress UspA family protein